MPRECAAATVKPGGEARAAGIREGGVSEAQHIYRYVLTFTKTSDTMAVLADAQERFPEAALIPVPHQISRSCGLAIEFLSWEPERQTALFESLTVPAALYRLVLRPTANGSSQIIEAEEVKSRI
jgi:Protein of unknown function (DUF3343).